MVKYTEFFTQIDANVISDANISQKHFKNQKHNNKKIHFFPLLYRFLALFLPYYKEMICLQHFYNIFITNPKCQVVISCYCWSKKVILVLISNLNQ